MSWQSSRCSGERMRRSRSRWRACPSRPKRKWTRRGLGFEPASDSGDGRQMGSFLHHILELLVEYLEDIAGDQFKEATKPRAKALLARLWPALRWWATSPSNVHLWVVWLLAFGFPVGCLLARLSGLPVP